MEDCYLIIKSTAALHCDVFCDGEYFIGLDPGMVFSGYIESGQHLFEFKLETEFHGELCVNKVVDLPSGKKYVLMEDELEEMINQVFFEVNGTVFERVN